MSDRTTPALTEGSAQRQLDRVDEVMAELGYDWRKAHGPLNGRIASLRALAAQQPDERVAELVEALEMDRGHERTIRAMVEDPRWAAQQDTRFWVAHVGWLLDAIDRARAALAQPTAAGGDSDA